MNTTRTLCRRAAMLAMAGMLACRGDDATSPTSRADFDTERAIADVSAIESALAGAVLPSLTTLAAHADLSPLAAGVVAAPPHLSAARPEAAAVVMAQRLMSFSAEHDAFTGRAVLPPSALGATFVYDAAQRRYVVDPARTGAPANAVRFVLYAVNPVTHEPVAGSEIGYADLLDESATRPSGVQLRLVVVSEGTTFLDYRVALDGTPAAGLLSVTGVAFDGHTHLRFGIEARARHAAEGAQLEVGFEFRVPERGFRAAGHVVVTRAADGRATQAVQLHVFTGDADIAFDVRTDGRAVDASVTVNDQPFATIRGDAHDPEIRGAGGRELTREEMQALHRMVQLAGGVLGAFGELLAPVAGILALVQYVGGGAGG
jgi:hypothetical protein